MKILVTGSSGLIGSALVQHLTACGHYVIRLVRKDPDRSRGDLMWDPAAGRIERSGLERLDGVVHLAGESILGLWTESKKQRIYRSRVPATEFLMESLAGLTHRPRVIISASAIGYYGNRGDTWLNEQSPPGHGFLASVCVDWEKATELASNAGIRVVNLRIGVVLSPAGGALKIMLPAFRLGLGGPLGSGKQYMSWIELGDLLSAINYCLEKEALRGPVNAVAPEPVTNREFARALGRALRRPTFLPVPGFALKLLLGDLARESLLASLRVEPVALRRAGFQFACPTLPDALKVCLR
ncbi:MAG: TIGR01777 family oxidoreductase [Kiritimatiellae bacterium]|nr:TIGR01777 family oxidoreductase [Kiritimatiellia bacterium]MDW8459468.1 TIGR01777 family oxidoreductase [Verrucomicrobiota bacterium]